MKIKSFEHSRLPSTTKLWLQRGGLELCRNGNRGTLGSSAAAKSIRHVTSDLASTPVPQGR